MRIRQIPSAHHGAYSLTTAADSPGPDAELVISSCIRPAVDQPAKIGETTRGARIYCVDGIRDHSDRSSVPGRHGHHELEVDLIDLIRFGTERAGRGLGHSRADITLCLLRYSSFIVVDWIIGQGLHQVLPLEVTSYFGFVYFVGVAGAYVVSSATKGGG